MSLPRRSLLLAAFLRAAKARAQAREAPRRLFELQPAGPDAWIALANPAAMLNCNAVIFARSDGLLVVDTHSKPSAAAALVAQLHRALPGKPVRYIVNTHFHYDHAHGNRAYRQLTPAARILATTETRRLLEQRAPQAVAASIESMRRQVDAARRKAADATRAEIRDWWLRFAVEADAYIAEMRAFAPELPDITFGDHLILEDRRQPLHLLFRGRAHTASDLCVLSPERKLVATGDLLVGFLPGMGDGYPAEWPATLRSLAELPFDTVLPGHGDVQQGRTRLEQKRAYIEELNERVADGKRRGATLDRLQNQITPPSLRTLAGSYGTYVRAMAARYRPLPPDADPSESVRDGVRGNVAAIYQKLP